MREREIEQYFVRRVREAGGLSRKFVSPGVRGVPDRIVAFEGRVKLVELKAPGNKLRPDQVREHAKWHKVLIPTFVLCTKEDVDRFVNHYM